MHNKKKGLFLLGICLLMGSLAACGGTTMEKTAYAEEELNSLEGIQMKAVESTYPVGTTGIEVVITNETDEEFAYGVDFAIEKQEANDWYVVPFEDSIAWIAIAHILAPNSENTEEISFDLLKNELEEGHYRVVKTIAGEPVTAEFTIEK